MIDTSDREKKDDSARDKYGRPFPNYIKYPAPILAADAVAIRQKKDGSGHEVLMCTRGKEPFKGKYVLPGGHVDYNEAPELACTRELVEETNVKGTNPKLLCVRGDPERDPRKHVVTIAYTVDVDHDQVPKGGDDADHAEFYDLKTLLSEKDKIGFDHIKILEEAVEKLGIKL
mmetsp:Transcript_35540/g.32036  ORF Transcript_35540/g.32036 Transcript_35540/m.32036 type:complete len:173 (-) Transcript_35540:124-642(-)